MSSRALCLVALAAAIASCADRETLLGSPTSPSPVATVARATKASSASSGDAASGPAAFDATSAPTADPDALMDRARTALDAHDLDEADKLAREAISADDAPSDAYVVIGDIALARHNSADALAAYDRALSLDPDDGWALVRASEALSALGKQREARDRLRAFIAHHENPSVDVLDALGWAELDSDERAQAKGAFTKALEVSGERDADAWYGLAVLAADGGNAREASRAMLRVLDLEPTRRAEVEKDEAFEPVRSSPEWRSLFHSAK
jgi:tetratricopeptide (TPR) repeat protein